jgi:hypothetical protein
MYFIGHSSSEMATATNDDSMLLDTPLELLHRITDNLRSEVLLSLRLTCKTLEGATFDRFAERYFTARRCCILSATRWAKLQTQLRRSPRLASEVQLIIVTADVYENHHRRLQLAPEEHFDNINAAQRQAIGSANSNEGLSFWLERNPHPDPAVIIDVIRQVQQASRHVVADLAIELPREHHTLCHDVIVAVASTRLAICKLTISPPITDAFGTSLAQH